MRRTTGERKRSHGRATGDGRERAQMDRAATRKERREERREKKERD